ncbi:flagellar basal body P-ring formation protein FlgA [Candidatus Saganbacteria bacterium]|uniref:Flagella basal body P-ring formation protein FlgA n=1 Tax=Candidatus Saganbacteria bacterium TaxID=2575572 RepID=A0A9D6ULB3_UNCSA|nr:flagellar basal body P-ring formation protein FlgA [Candidatus Saganbacteria bacterium]
MSFIIIMASSSQALDNPEQKAAGIIKDYILTKYPDWSRDEIRVTFKLAEKTFDSLRKLDEGAVFRVLEVYPEFKPVGSVMFPVEVRSGAGSQQLLGSQKFFLRAKVEVVKKIAAAAKLCRKGKPLEAGDLKLDERDIALLPQKYFTEISSLVSKEAKITIPANSTIFEWMVGDPPFVRRGSEVTIMAVARGILVKTKGEALEDGWRDTEIKVKRVGNEKVFSARVVSPGEVEVKL